MTAESESRRGGSEPGSLGGRLPESATGARSKVPRRPSSEATTSPIEAAEVSLDNNDLASLVERGR